MKGIIFYGSSFVKANEELKKMVDRYNQMRIPVIKCHYKKIGSYAEFENGDVWRVVGASDNARGHRCNVAYVERCVDYNIYRTVIMHCLTAAPFTAINLWGEGDLHITPEPPLPF